MTFSSSGVESHLLKIAICVATPWEFNAIRKALPAGKKQDRKGYRCLVDQTGKRDVFVLQTGMGHENVVAAWHALLNDQPWDLIVSSGFAGALVTASVGTLVVSSCVLVLDRDDTLESCIQGDKPSVLVNELVPLVMKRMGQEPLSGPVVAVQKIVWKAAQKASIAHHTRGLALDMESGTIGKLAVDRCIPFLVVRTISDLLEENLPLDLNVLCQKSTWMPRLLKLILHPRQFGQLNRLRKQMVVASEQLTGFFRVFCVQAERFA